jgi:hypothetical protein
LSSTIAPRLRWVAWLDLVVTGLFVFPAIAHGVIALLLDVELGLFGPGRVVPLPVAPWSIFISLMGILGVVWASARLIVEDDRLCLIDAAARMIVASLIVYGLLLMSLPWVFVGFILTELLGTVATAILWRQKSALTRLP